MKTVPVVRQQSAKDSFQCVINVMSCILFSVKAVCSMLATFAVQWQSQVMHAYDYSAFNIMISVYI